MYEVGPEPGLYTFCGKEGGRQAWLIWNFWDRAFNVDHPYTSVKPGDTCLVLETIYTDDGHEAIKCLVSGAVRFISPHSNFTVAWKKIL